MRMVNRAQNPDLLIPLAAGAAAAYAGHCSASRAHCAVTGSHRLQRGTLLRCTISAGRYISAVHVLEQVLRAVQAAQLGLPAAVQNLQLPLIVRVLHLQNRATPVVSFRTNSP